MGMGMNDEALIEHYQPLDVTCDGFTQYVSINGIMRCVGYAMQPIWPHNEPQRVVVARLRFPVCCIDAAIFETRNAMCRPMEPGLSFGRH